MATANGLIPLLPPTMSIISNKLQEGLKLLNLRPGLPILMQKSVILNARCTVRTFLAEQ
jgi:hypothetical protein